MHRHTRLVSLVAIALAGVMATTPVPLSTSAQDASPAAEEAGPPAGIADETLAFGLVESLPETPAMIFLDRLTLDSGAILPGEPGDPTFAFVLVESGSLTLRADAALSITRADTLAEALASGAMPAQEEVAAESDVTLEAGDSVVLPSLVGVTLRNDGTEPATMLGAIIAPAEGM
jgi:hypothetical protein